VLLTVTLVGSRLAYEGRLEVYYNGVWGTVCDDSFGDVDATVACKSLGSGLINYISSSVETVSPNYLTLFRIALKCSCTPHYCDVKVVFVFV